MTDSEWLTTIEVAKLWGVSRWTVPRYADRYGVPYRVLPSGRRRYAVAEVTRFAVLRASAVRGTQ